MPVTVFIQEHSGDYNFEETFETRLAAEEAVSKIKAKKGYWRDEERTIWVPWHRVDFVRFDETNG